MTRRTGWTLFVWILAGCSSAPLAEPPSTPAPETAPEASGAPPAEATAPTTAPALDTIKVATWNLEWLNRANDTGNVKRSDADYERLKRYAERLDADIVAVQEVDGEEALRRVFDDATYDYHVAPQNGIQLTGFAYKPRLSITKNPDYSELDVGDVRVGTDLTVTVNNQSVRLLSAHLKSGCFDQALSTSTNACQKLKAQLPVLEEGIDACAQAGEAFLVLGDINRRMKTGEVFYTEIDDGDLANADLTLVTDGRTSGCWGGEFPQFIEHIVLSKNAAPWMAAQSFAQLEYDTEDTAFKPKLSDHYSIGPTPGSAGTGGSGTDPSALPIKGNSEDKELYLLPTCRSYQQTAIDESQGERFFASDAEAVAAGWQKAGNCP